MRASWMVWLALGTEVLGQQVEEDIRGPKALIEIPVPEEPTPWGIYAIIGLLALAMIGALIWMVKQRSKPEISVEELARRELDRLGREGAKLDAGDFAMTASQVVRVFIEGKFGLAAPKRTTEEFLQELSTMDHQDLCSRVEPLRGFLKSCDKAKFAGADLGVGDRGELVAKARAFIDAPEPEEGKEAA